MFLENKKRISGIILLVLALCLSVYIFFAYVADTIYPCLGVEILSGDVEAAVGGDEGFALLFNDMPAPYDAARNTFYISQNIAKRMWDGTLEPSDPAYRIYFLSDTYFRFKLEAINTSHAFTLVAEKDNCYSKYNVIFTSLPVLNMTSSEESGPNAWNGKMQLFDPVTLGQYVIQTNLAYHVRGYSSSTYPKKGYKLSLKDDDGNNRNIGLLGMPSDDDWILNALYSDDEKIREKLVQDLWNTMADTSGSALKLKLARSEFVEVVIDNEYRGLYTLGTRLDAKYLGVDSTDTTIFQLKYYRTVTEDDWRSMTDEREFLGPLYLVSSGNRSDAWKLIREYSRQYIQDDWPSDPEKVIGMVDIENQVDSCLIGQFAWLADNMWTNNVQYVVSGGKYYRLLWDLDISFGNHYVREENGELVFLEDRYLMAYDDVITMDMWKLLEYDDSLWERIRERYRELRSDVFDPQVVTAYVDVLKNRLIKSGVFIREAEAYPNEKITPDAEWLKDWINRRIEHLDTYFHYS